MKTKKKFKPYSKVNWTIRIILLLLSICWLVYFFFSIAKADDYGISLITSGSYYEHWTLDVGSTKDVNGIKLVNNLTAEYASYTTSLLPNKEYTLVYEITEETLSNDGIFLNSYLTGSYEYIPSTVGIHLYTFTTQNTITTNKVYFKMNEPTNGNYAIIKNISLYSGNVFDTQALQYIALSMPPSSYYYKVYAEVDYGTIIKNLLFTSNKPFVYKTGTLNYLMQGEKSDFKVYAYNKDYGSWSLDSQGVDVFNGWTDVQIPEIKLSNHNLYMFDTALTANISYLQNMEYTNILNPDISPIEQNSISDIPKSEDYGNDVIGRMAFGFDVLVYWLLWIPRQLLYLVSLLGLQLSETVSQWTGVIAMLSQSMSWLGTDINRILLICVITMGIGVILKKH